MQLLGPRVIALRVPEIVLALLQLVLLIFKAQSARLDTKRLFLCIYLGDDLVFLDVIALLDVDLDELAGRARVGEGNRKTASPRVD